MIVFVVGGHGSGKSTAVRKIMERRALVPMTSPGRRGPLGYEDTRVFFVGRYDIVNGGADTVRPLSTLERLVRVQASRGLHVVMEGVGQAGIVDHVISLARKLPVTVVQLTTDVEECYRSMRKRGHKLSKEGVRRSWVRSERMAKKFETAGVQVVRATRRNVYEKIKEMTR